VKPFVSLPVTLSLFALARIRHPYGQFADTGRDLNKKPEHSQLGRISRSRDSERIERSRKASS
jgi:hypothetical protein